MPRRSLPRLRRSLVHGFALLLATPGTNARPLAAPLPAVNARLSRLALDVRVDYATSTIDGTATLVVQNASTVPITTIPLLLNRLLRVSSVHASGGAPLHFTQDTRTFSDDSTMRAAVVSVALTNPLPAARSTTLRIRYSGPLGDYVDAGMLYVKDHVDRAFTILREDAYAFPVIGVPSWDAMRAAPRAPFPFDVAVTVPRGLTVATGGESLGTTTHGELVTWRARSRAPAPFLLVTIAPYGVIESHGLRVYHFPGDSTGARAIAAATGRAARRLGQLLGPPAQPLSLSIMEIPEGWGSQASATGGIIQEATAFRDRAPMGEVYHELSHLWNAADLDVPSPRWNEGLAMFLQGRLTRELDGATDEDAALQRTIDRLGERCVAPAPCATVPMARYGAEGLTDQSYLVGRLLFASLYRQLGETRFDRALRLHFQRDKVRGTTTARLRATFIGVGDGTARAIFERWLDTTAWVTRIRDAKGFDEVLR